MDLVLDLHNFESADAEGSRYVLTSPRSLEACARMNVRPIQLLRKPIEDFIEENPGKAIPLLQVFHDDHENKRLDILRKCQEIRRTLIMEAKLGSKKRSDEHGRIIAGKRAAEGQNKVRNMSPNSQLAATRSKSVPQQKKKKERLVVSKSLSDYRQCEDVNNNDALYEVISNRESPKAQNKTKIPMRNDVRPLQNVSRFSPGQATFTKSKHLIGKSESEETEQPYMISTPRIQKKFTSTTVKTLDRNWRSRAKKSENDEVKAEDNIESNTSRSPRSLSTNSDLHLRTRSKSLDARVRKPRKTSDFELASSLKFTSSRMTSGYSTPQMQKDQKIVEVMKDKRKQEKEHAQQRYKKHLEWEEQKKNKEKKKMQEGTQMRRELAVSHLEWEKRIKEREEKRVSELRRIEEERQHIQMEMEKKLKENKESQERLRLQIIEEKKKSSSLRKQQQKATKESLERDVQAFQDATQQEIEDKLEKAQKSKLEMELKELNKIQTMNKSQRDRCLQLQKELRKRREEEEERMRNSLQNKMEKAEMLHVRKLSEREQTLKEQMRETKLKQTKSNQEKITKETEDYLQSVAEHKKEILKRANTTALKNILSKSKRAQQIREVSQEEQKRKLKQIEEEEEQYLMQTKEDIEMKKNRAKTHQQLKETAIQLSRAHARATEVARLEVKRKDDTFLDAVKQAQLNASIGKGVRTGAVNASSVKFG